MIDDEDVEPTVRFCANCGKPIMGVWVFEIDGAFYHSALNYRGPDRRRCRYVALRVAQ